MVVGAVAAVVASSPSRDWIATRLGLATASQAAAAQAAAGAARSTAGAARSTADAALARARLALTKEALGNLQSRVSSLDLGLSRLGVSVRDHETQLAAACDWARLQQTNFEGTSLGNAFFDFTETVCPRK